MMECPDCRGDGRDRYTDYLMECECCGGTGAVDGFDEGDGYEVYPTSSTANPTPEESR